MTVFRATLLGGVDGIITSFAVVAGAHAGHLDRSVVRIVGLSSIIADGLSMGVSEYLSSVSDIKVHGKIYYSPVLSGVACFCSFVVCGLIPLLTSNANLLASAAFSITALMLLGIAKTVITKEEILWAMLQTTLLGSLAGGVGYVAYAGALKGSPNVICFFADVFCVLISHKYFMASRNTRSSIFGRCDFEFRSKEIMVYYTTYLYFFFHTCGTPKLCFEAWSKMCTNSVCDVSNQHTRSLLLHSRRTFSNAHNFRRGRPRWTFLFWSTTCGVHVQTISTFSDASVF